MTLSWADVLGPQPWSHKRPNLVGSVESQNTVLCNEGGATETTDLHRSQLLPRGDGTGLSPCFSHWLLLGSPFGQASEVTGTQKPTVPNFQKPGIKMTICLVVPYPPYGFRKSHTWVALLLSDQHRPSMVGMAPG